MSRAILTNGSRCALAAARCLRLAGIPTVVIARTFYDLAALSRCSSRSIFLASQDEDDLVDSLLTLREEGGTIFPMSDASVRHFVKHRATLERFFNLAMPADNVALSLLDKDREMETVAKSGVLLPKSVSSLPASPDELGDALGFPLLIKPKREGLEFEAKNFLIHTLSELRSFYTRHAARFSDLVAQEYIPGGPTTLWTCTCVFNREHELVSAFTFYKFRTNPVRDGSTSVARNARNGEVVELSRTIGKKLGYTGIADMEFKYDERSGRYVYLETNPRVIHTSEFAARCGVNQVAQTYQVVNGIPVSPIREAPSDGYFFVDLFAEVQGRVDARQAPWRILRGFLPLLFLRARGTWFSLADPLPVFHVFIRVILKGVQWLQVLRSETEPRHESRAVRSLESPRLERSSR